MTIALDVNGERYELEVPPDEQIFPTPEKRASEPADVPDPTPVQPAKVPA